MNDQNAPKGFSRRSLLQILAATPLVGLLPACASQAPHDGDNSESKPAGKVANAGRANGSLGHLTIIQGPTSSTETLINVYSPRLKNYSYEVTGNGGQVGVIEPYEVVTGPALFKIVKLRISGLALNQTYTLKVIDSSHNKTHLVDERRFQTLDVNRTDVRFALLSCCSDDSIFEAVIDPIWDRLRRENPDFILMNGDAVYVDAYEYVNKEVATELDLWQRYIDTFRRISMYHWRDLKPIFANWDDHDFGSNDGDRTFGMRTQVTKLFKATFSGPELPGVWTPGAFGESSEITAFGQTFFLMDDRTYRQPNKKQKTHELYGHWGKDQYNWFISRVREVKGPVWIVNGNQYFSSKPPGEKESFQENHPANFAKLIEDLRGVNAKVIFASGDVHFSEITRVPKEQIGYETFELTSSAMHSTVDKVWENPLRLPGARTLEFNFMMISSRVAGTGLDLSVQSFGVAKDAYFSQELRLV